MQKVLRSLYNTKGKKLQISLCFNVSCCALLKEFMSQEMEEKGLYLTYVPDQHFPLLYLFVSCKV